MFTIEVLGVPDAVREAEADQAARSDLLSSVGQAQRRASAARPSGEARPSLRSTFATKNFEPASTYGARGSGSAPGGMLYWLLEQPGVEATVDRSFADRMRIWYSPTSNLASMRHARKSRGRSWTRRARIGATAPVPPTVQGVVHHRRLATGDLAPSTRRAAARVHLTRRARTPPSSSVLARRPRGSTTGTGTTIANASGVEPVSSCSCIDEDRARALAHQRRPASRR